MVLSTEPADLAGICAAAAETIDKLRLRTYNPSEASRRLTLLADQMDRLPGDRSSAAFELEDELRALAGRLDVDDQLADVSRRCRDLGRQG